MRSTALLTITALTLGLIATGVFAQRGTGSGTGVARQAVDLETSTIKGKVAAVETGPCKHTTGRATSGVHILLTVRRGEQQNVHLGPQTAVQDIVDRLQVGQKVTAKVFHTEAMEEGHFVALTLDIGKDTVQLRDATGRVVRVLGTRAPGHCRAEDLGDDTAQSPGGEGRPLVQSLDVLRQLLADPWLMGRIAANHALSDLYASGARPISALASVTLPFASEALLQRELEQLLAGALHEFAAADCRLTGGHSLQGAELNLGFVVNGAPPAGESLLPKTGLAPGDKLVLTKPLGTGALFAAHMQLRADGRDISHAIDSMLQSNAQAAELARAHGASACTDITGFGLAGHLLEMLLPGQSARLHCAALPVLPGALEALDAGLRSSMHEANAAMAADLARGGGARQIIFDPQTSGGLLIGIAAERAQLLCEALQSAGYAQAAIAGEVTETSADRSPALELA